MCRESVRKKSRLEPIISVNLFLISPFVARTFRPSLHKTLKKEIVVYLVDKTIDVRPLF